MTRSGLLLIMALPFVLACSLGSRMNPEVLGEVAGGVLTLQGGTLSELRNRRGTGPFRRYDISPDALLDVVADAARKARGPDGRPIDTVWVKRGAMEVVAKEPAPEAKSDRYTEPWRSAMVAIVHPIVGEQGASRLEIHAMDKGPFHKGRIRWEARMPGWIDEVLRAPRLYPGGIKPIR